LHQTSSSHISFYHSFILLDVRCVFCLPTHSHFHLSNTIIADATTLKERLFSRRKHNAEQNLLIIDGDQAGDMSSSPVARSSGRADYTGMQHSCWRGNSHLVEERGLYDSYIIAHMFENVYGAMLVGIGVYICVYFHLLTYMRHNVGYCLSLACPVHQETRLTMKTVLSGGCRNVLVVVA
jgi:hypothetical protein